MEVTAQERSKNYRLRYVSSLKEKLSGMEDEDIYRQGEYQYDRDHYFSHQYRFLAREEYRGRSKVGIYRDDVDSGPEIVDGRVFAAPQYEGVIEPVGELELKVFNARTITTLVVKPVPDWIHLYADFLQGVVGHRTMLAHMCDAKESFKKFSEQITTYSPVHPDNPNLRNLGCEREDVLLFCYPAEEIAINVELMIYDLVIRLGESRHGSKILRHHWLRNGDMLLLDTGRLPMQLDTAGWTLHITNTLFQGTLSDVHSITSDSITTAASLVGRI